MEWIDSIKDPRIAPARALSTRSGRIAAGRCLIEGEDSVAITREGEHAIAALWAVQERVEDDLYEGFTDAERHQLRDLLRRIQGNAARLVRSATP
jgi:hypothetical protein